MSMNVREQGCLFHFVEQKKEGSTEVKNSASGEVSMSQLAALLNGHEMICCEVTKRAKLRLT